MKRLLLLSCIFFAPLNLSGIPDCVKDSAVMIINALQNNDGELFNKAIYNYNERSLIVDFNNIKFDRTPIDANIYNTFSDLLRNNALPKKCIALLVMLMTFENLVPTQEDMNFIIRGRGGSGLGYYAKDGKLYESKNKSLVLIDIRHPKYWQLCLLKYVSVRIEMAKQKDSHVRS